MDIMELHKFAIDKKCDIAADAISHFNFGITDDDIRRVWDGYNTRDFDTRKKAEDFRTFCSKHLLRFELEIVYYTTSNAVTASEFDDFYMEVLKPIQDKYDSLQG